MKIYKLALVGALVLLIFAALPATTNAVSSLSGCTQDVSWAPDASPWHQSGGQEFTFTSYETWILTANGSQSSQSQTSSLKCTTGANNGDTCIIHGDKPVANTGDTIDNGCHYVKADFTSPQNRVDTVAPVCPQANIWGGKGTPESPFIMPETVDAPATDASGMSGVTSYNPSDRTCVAAIGSTCQVSVADNAGNSINCDSPIRKPDYFICSITPAPAQSPSSLSLTDKTTTPDNSSASYKWTENGAQIATGAAASYAFTSAGIHTVTVINASGKSAECSADIPPASPDGDNGATSLCTVDRTNIVAGEAITFKTNATCSRLTRPGFVWSAPSANPAYGYDSQTFITTFPTAGSFSDNQVSCGSALISKCPVITVQPNGNNSNAQTATILVTSNMPSTWQISGPDMITQPTDATSGSYPARPGTYVLTPTLIQGYDATVNVPTQTVSDKGTINFEITYTRQNCSDGATPAATLTIAPPTQSIAVGANANFRAYYDADGPSCIMYTTQEVTQASLWRSGNTAIATIAGQGTAHGVAPGTTPITAAYAGLTATASLNVTGAQDFACSISPSSITLAPGESKQGTATCVPIGNFNGTIGLSAQNVPSNTNMGMSPAAVPASSPATYTYTATASSVPGAYTIQIAAVSGSITHAYPLYVTITGNSCSGPGCDVPCTGSSCHLECRNNMCTSVSGAGSNQNGCLSAGVSCVTVNPPCDGLNCHLACVNNMCAIVSGAGSNQNGCLSVGTSCAINDGLTGTCKLTASPSIIKKGDSSTLSWTCTAALKNCVISGPNVVSTDTARSKAIVKPTQTSPYTLRCDGGGSTAPVSVYVVQSYDETNPGN